MPRRKRSYLADDIASEYKRNKKYEEYEVKKVNPNQYFKAILDKKGITYQALCDIMNERGLTEGGELTKGRISERVNGTAPITPCFARRVELALDLPKYSFVRIVGFPTTEYEKKKLEDIG